MGYYSTGAGGGGGWRAGYYSVGSLVSRLRTAGRSHLAQVEEIVGKKVADIDDAFKALTIPLAVPAATPKVGPWIEKGQDAVDAGRDALIRKGQLVGGKVLTDCFKSLGTSAAVSSAVGSGAAAVAAALASGASTQQVVGAGIDAITPVLAAVVPWGTAAAGALQLGKALYMGFGGDDDQPPPPTLGALDWGEFKDDLIDRSQIPTDLHAEMLGRLLSGEKMDGALAGFATDAARETFKAMLRNTISARRSGKQNYRRVALTLGYLNLDVWKGWISALDSKWAYEMASWAGPRVLLRECFAIYGFWIYATSRSNDRTANFARGVEASTYQRALAARLLPQPEVNEESGLYEHRTFPLAVAREEAEYLRSQAVSATAPGTKLKEFRFPQTLVDAYAGGLKIETEFHAPAEAIRRMKALALQDRKWLELLAPQIREMRRQNEAAARNQKTVAVAAVKSIWKSAKKAGVKNQAATKQRKAFAIGALKRAYRRRHGAGVKKVPTATKLAVGAGVALLLLKLALL